MRRIVRTRNPSPILRLLILAVPLVVAWRATAPESGPGTGARHPVLSFKSPVASDSVIPSQLGYVIPFQLANESSEQVIIRRVRAGCSCTTVDSGPWALRPGESKVVNATFDFAPSTLMDVTKFASVLEVTVARSHQSMGRSCEFPFEFSVAPTVVWPDDVLPIWQLEIPANHPAQRSFRTVFPRVRALINAEIRAVCDAASGAVSAEFDAEGLNLEYQPPQRLEVGEASFPVELELMRPGGDVIRVADVQVQLRICGTIDAWPRELDFMFFAADSEPTADVQLTSRSRLPFTICAVRTPAWLHHVKRDGGGFGRDRDCSHDLRFYVEGPPGKGRRFGLLVVESRIAGSATETIRIPVCVHGDAGGRPEAR